MSERDGPYPGPPSGTANAEDRATEVRGFTHQARPGCGQLPTPRRSPATVRQGAGQGAPQGRVRGRERHDRGTGPHVGVADLPIAHQAPGRPHRAGPLHRAAQQRSPSRARRSIKVEQGYVPPANHHRRLDASPRAYQASEHPRPSGGPARALDRRHCRARRHQPQHRPAPGCSPTSRPWPYRTLVTLTDRRRMRHQGPPSSRSSSATPGGCSHGVLLLNDSQTPARRVGYKSEVRHQPLAYPRLSTTLAL
jgi:hypothetical protein